MFICYLRDFHIYKGKLIYFDSFSLIALLMVLARVLSFEVQSLSHPT
jgi:hypothetical protein